jgi:hypothetical protein
MANDLVTLLASNPALVQTGLDEDTLAVAGGGGAARSKRVSIKGGVFRLMSGGKEIGAIEDRHMNVIFVKMAHQASRMYYESGYQEGQKISPTCWSADSSAPDPEVKTPKASKCSECEMSVKGSGQGGLGSACRLSWRTAVVLPNDPSGDVMQLVLPATSTFGKEDNGRFPFRPYVQHLASHNVSAGRVVTKMAFDTKSPTPKVLFSPAGAVPEADLEIIARQSKSAAAEAAIKMNVFQTDENEVVEPQKRPVAKAAEVPEKDISDVVKKWSKK